MSKIIYCISGLGADEKIFAKLQFTTGYRLKHIPWLKPGKNESIADYATRMRQSIDEELPILLGVSFGGIMAIEIARQIAVKKLILVSSVKSTLEIPAWMRWAGRWKINKMVPIRSYKFTERIDNSRLGVSNEEEKEIARYYRRNADPVYLKWAVNQVLNWKNDWLPEAVLHVHGNRDKIFPVQKISNVAVIQEGTHFMVYNRAGEVSAVINEWLEKDAIK